MASENGFVTIIYTPIGIVHSPFKTLSGIPRQSYMAQDVAATVEVYHPYAEGLMGLEGFSHLLLLCHFHNTHSYSLRIRPDDAQEEQGLFATRAPARPNPIGLSIVRLAGIHGNRLSILDVDLLDQTPVLDIKPYVNEYERLSGVRLGWIDRREGKEDAGLNESEEIV